MRKLCSPTRGTAFSLSFALALLMGLSTSVLLPAGEYSITKILSSDGALGDQFGAAVAISGNWAIVGAHNQDAVTLNSGAAYLFELTAGEWTQRQKLAPVGLDVGDLFGQSVWIEGDLAIVGAREDDDKASNAGAAYIYRFDGSSWIEEQKLTGSDSQSGDAFGDAVHIEGNYAMVGARYNDGSRSNAGAVYMFSHNGSSWQQDQKLSVSTGSTDLQFGYHIALDGTYAAIGAYGDDMNGLNAGAAYIFERVGGVWTEKQRLTAADADAGDMFGVWLGLSGATLAIGAREDDEAAGDAGAVYIFTRNQDGSWNQDSKLTAEDAAAGDKFGEHLAIEGDRIIVGASPHDEAALNGGAVYLFTLIGGVWQQTGKFIADGLDDHDHFGTGVGISGENLISGAHGDDDNGSSAGAIYMLEQLCYSVGSDECMLNKVLSSDGVLGDQFGAAVAVSGRRAIVGAHNSDARALNGGAAYFYEESNGIWTQMQQVLPGGLDANDLFGQSVWIDANLAIVGAREDDDRGLNAGAAYVYRFDGSAWIEEQKLTGSDTEAGDEFGDAVVVDGDLVMVSARYADGALSNAGAVYVFEYDGDSWEELQILSVSTSSTDLQFGNHLALHADVAVIGAYGDDANGVNAGAAYLFERSGALWNERQRLTAADADAGDMFGVWLGISGQTVLIGAREDDEAASDAGAAYVFTRCGNEDWTQEAKLMAPDAAAGDKFGEHLAIDGKRIVVGASPHDAGALNGGAAYLFDYANGIWTPTDKFYPCGLDDHDHFGTAVGISGDQLIFGAHGDDDQGSSAGAVYLLNRACATLVAPAANLETPNGNPTAIHNDDLAIGNAPDAQPALYPSVPNPARQQLTIPYYLPATGGAAEIVLRDNLGRRLGVYPLQAKGAAQLLIDASQLTPGAYRYSLLVDGRPVATRSLVLIR